MYSHEYQDKNEEEDKQEQQQGINVIEDVCAYRRTTCRCYHDIEHARFFLFFFEFRDGGALLSKRRSSSVSNQLSTLPIKIFTTYYSK